MSHQFSSFREGNLQQGQGPNVDLVLRERQAAKQQPCLLACQGQSLVNLWHSSTVQSHAPGIDTLRGCCSSQDRVHMLKTQIQNVSEAHSPCSPWAAEVSLFAGWTRARQIHMHLSTHRGACTGGTAAPSGTFVRVSCTSTTTSSPAGTVLLSRLKLRSMSG